MYISIPKDLQEYLDKEAPKDENGQREETYSATIKRLLKRSEAK